MIRYTAEQKENALNRMQEIGAKKTQEELGISVQTLYKWRTERAGGAPKPAAKEKKAKKQNDDVKALLNDDDALLEKLNRLESENAALLAMNMKLKKALKAFVDM